MTYARRRRWYNMTRKRIQVARWTWLVLWLSGGLLLSGFLPFKPGQLSIIIGLFVGAIGFELAGCLRDRCKFN